MFSAHLISTSSSSQSDVGANPGGKIEFMHPVSHRVRVYYSTVAPCSDAQDQDQVRANHLRYQIQVANEIFLKKMKMKMSIKSLFIYIWGSKAHRSPYNHSNHAFQKTDLHEFSPASKKKKMNCVNCLKSKNNLARPNGRSHSGDFLSFRSLERGEAKPTF